MSEDRRYVIVRQTVTTGRRWYYGRAGRAWSGDFAYAQTFGDYEQAKRTALIAQRDLDRGIGGQRVYVEPAPTEAGE